MYFQYVRMKDNKYPKFKEALKFQKEEMMILVEYYFLWEHLTEHDKKKLKRIDSEKQ